MNNTAGRGWLFHDQSNSVSVAAIENTGEIFAKSISFMPNQNTTTNYGSDLVHYAPCVPGGTLNNNGSSQTGYLRIKLPTSAASMMGGFTVRGYDYNQTKGGWAVRLDFYEYVNSNAFVNENVSVLYGNPPFDVVYFGKANSNTERYILLGASTTAWAYSQIAITDFFAGYSGQDNHLVSGNWTLDISSGAPSGWVNEAAIRVSGQVRWDDAETGKNLGGNITISTSAASGGSNGDIHFKY